MILLILIFGGSKKNNILQIEYNFDNYKYLELLNIFEKQLEKYNSNEFNFLKITDKIDLSDCIIPNIVDIFFINIKPQSYFFINEYVTDKISKLMVIYNHNLIKNNLTDDLMLLLNIKNNFAYYYDITKKISILDIYPIYNNSKMFINITVFIIRKSFWYL
jgi:hypothetical protein